MNLFLLAALTVLGVDPYAENPHLPDEVPGDARETTSFALFAAQGEIESTSWLVKSEKDVARLTYRFSDLKGPGGATIPASALDLKVVKVWFQPGGFWETSWAGNIHRPEAIPGPLFHDDSVVRVDWTNKVNYLRIDYADGPIYCRMSGTDLTDPLNHSIHPIRDAAAYVPCALEAGRLKQFWLTVKTPADAKPGVYTGDIAMSADGAVGPVLSLRYTVHPFSLPQPRTHYDSSRPFYSGVSSAITVQDFLGQGHDLAHAERKSYAAYRMLVEHNVLHAEGPGAVLRESPDDMAYRTLHVMRRAGMPLDLISSGGTVSGEKSENPNEWPEEAYARRMTSLYDRYAAPGWRAYYTGADEASVEQCREQYGTWSSLKMHGGRACSAMAQIGACGWSLDICHTPALISHSHARAWHWYGGRVTTYASPFAGPECPEIWRRTKGLRFYYSDFDGITEYCLYYHARNRWNEFIPSPDHYRSFGLVYPAYEELIGTVALEGFREGMDDIRYLTLLRLRAEAALKSGDAEKVLLGKRNLAWMDSRDPERIGQLDEFRLALVRRIVELIAAVGPEPAPAPLRPMPALGPTSTDRLAADESVPALKRAQACAAANRYELAIPLFAKARTDARSSASDKLVALHAEAKLRLEMLDRKGALAAFDGVLADEEIPLDWKAKLEAERMEAELTQVKFRERFTAKQIAAAEKALARLAGHGLPAEQRFSLTFKLARLVLDSDNPAAALRYDEKFGRDNGFNDAQCGRLLYCRVEACRRVGGMDREAYQALKRVKDLGGGNLIGERRNLGGEIGEYAERFGDYKTAQQYYSMSMQAWPPANDVWYPRWRAALTRVTAKLSKTTKVSESLSTEEEIISLDEE